MSGGNFNDTTQKAGTGGLSQNLLTQTASVAGDVTTSGTGPTTVTGLSLDVVTSRANQSVKISVQAEVYSNGSGGQSFTLGYKVGAGSFVGCSTTTNPGSGFAFNAGFTVEVVIPAAGTNTIVIQYATSGGSPTFTINGTAGSSAVIASVQITPLATGAGTGSSPTLVSASLSSDFAASSTSMANVTGLSLSVTSGSTSDIFILSFSGMLDPSVSTGLAITLGYTIDGGSDVLINKSAGGEAGTDGDAAFSVAITGLAVGAHTIQLRYKVANNTMTFNGTAGTFPVCTFSSLQFSGNGQLTSWQDFTPTGSWTTNTTYTGKYRQVGDTLEVRVKMVLAGAPNSTSLQVNLPAGFTIDTGKLLTPTADVTLVDGVVNYRDVGIASWHGNMSYHSTTSINLHVLNTSGTYLNPTQVDQSTPFSFGNTDFIEMTFKVPVL